MFGVLFAVPATMALASGPRGGPPATPRGSGSAAALAVRFAPSASASAQAGGVLYAERCSTCHGDRGQGSAFAPAIAGLGPAWYDFMLTTGRMPLDRPVIQASRKPPAFDPRQIQELVAYLAALPPGGGAPVPAVDPAAGQIGRGQLVFEANCAPCHGATGNGGAVGPQVAPPLHVATARQIGEAVRIGPGTMPRFDPTTISAHDLDSVIRYVGYLREPDDRGGAGLGHVGPIVEGFVGLVFGLGSLLLLTRFIGTRA